jgi:predicted Zn-dependent protease
MVPGILAEMTTPLIANLEKLVGTPRDGALLRYSLGNEYLKAGQREQGIEHLREALRRDPQYSAAWKALGRALADANRVPEARDAYARGIEAARVKGDRQAEKEMTVFARRLERHGGA